MLVDTGAHPDTHYHWDHVGGLLTLRRELRRNNRKALSIVHVSDGIFDSRPSETGERNQMIARRKEPTNRWTERA